jgi:hypothetical protein
MRCGRAFIRHADYFSLTPGSELCVSCHSAEASSDRLAFLVLCVAFFIIVAALGWFFPETFR